MSLELRVKLMLRYIESCGTMVELYESYYWRFNQKSLGENIFAIEIAYQKKMHQFKRRQ